MAGDLLLAVTDGPAGTHAVDMPEDRWHAIRLRERYDRRFWCSTEAGGCGGGLLVAAGQILRPHFRHRADTRCEFIGSESRAGPAYEHLRYQRALLRWLEGQGYAPVLEKALGADGRTDLHVAVASIRHAIEVQLSPLSPAVWRDRDNRYRRHHEYVTWLYGPAAEAAGATELSLRGVAFAVRPGPCVGVRDVDAKTHWAELADCRLTSTGFHVPGLEDARALDRIRRTEAEEARRRAKAEAIEKKRFADAQRAQRERGQAATREARERSELETGQQPVCLNFDPLLEGLERWKGRNPEAALWEPGIGWGWLARLPEELHKPARALTYCTQVLCFAGPARNLLPGVITDDERWQILGVLQDLQLIKIDWPRPDLVRFERLTT